MTSPQLAHNNKCYCLLVKSCSSEPSSGVFKLLRKFHLTNIRDDGLNGQYLTSAWYSKAYYPDETDTVEYMLTEINDTTARENMESLVTYMKRNPQYTLERLKNKFDFLSDIWHFHLHLASVDNNRESEWIEAILKNRNDAKLILSVHVMLWDGEKIQYNVSTPQMEVVFQKST